MPLFLARFLLTYWTTSVTVTEPVSGFAPPVVALTVTGYDPAGVPGLWVELLLLLHEASHSVEKPSTTIRLRKRKPRAARLREPAVKTIPSKPGSRAAKKMPRPVPRGGCICAVGATVVMFTVTGPAVGFAGATVHTDPDADKFGADVSLQVNVSGVLKPFVG